MKTDKATEPKPVDGGHRPATCGGCVFLIPATNGDVARCRCQPPIVYRTHLESVYPAVKFDQPCGHWTDLWPEP
jgi:hypothetical protein